MDVYVRNNGQIFTRGFNGSTEFALSGGTNAALSTLFIARTAVDVFELGYYDSTGRNVLATRTIGGANAAGIGSSIGFYADVRSAGIVGSLDNLTLSVIPEPTSMALLTLGGVTLAWMRRKR